MLNLNESGGPVRNDTDRLCNLVTTFTHPEDVLHNRRLGPAEKRAVLAGWASDAHAVPNLPSMRQLDSGAIVSIDSVLAALKALDLSEPTRPGPRTRSPWPKRKIALISPWRRPPSPRKGDDDDEPPPCPTTALLPGVELELRRRRDEAWGLAAA